MATIDYKEKYMQALERARQFSEKPYLEDSAGIVEYIFPELKESEDEWVRKEIISFFDRRINECSFEKAKEEYKTWIAWLEKQGEPVEINPTEFDTRLQALVGKFDSLPKEELIGSLSFWLNVVQNDGTYKSDEKQGEQKTTKPTDLRTWKYIVDAVLTEREGIGQYIDSPWTTEVAEKLQKRFGNIEQKPIQMKSAEESLGIDSDTYNKIVDECIFGEQKSEEIDNLHNYLYGEQKPDDKSEFKPKFKTGDRVIGIISGMQYYITGVCDDHYNTESGCIIMFCSQDNFDLYEQKPAWSEEDEEILDGIIVDVEVLKGQDRTKGGKAVYQEEIDWLKSLKDRVQPQPKQEWSEEDEKMLYEIIDFFKNGTVKLQHDLSLYANWLKSLRPQSQWKPSEEQMDALDFAVDCTIYPEFQEKRKALKELLAQLNRIKL